MPSATTAWIDCPACRQTQLAVIPAPTPTGRRGRHAHCPGCRAVLRVREIRVAWTAAHPLTRECPPECLNGRTDCSCRCGGRCHGMRVCLCRSEAPWTPPRHLCSSDDSRPLTLF